jgi:hypothetical protein
MVERAEKDRFNWRFPIYAAVSASLVFLALVIWSYDFGDLFYLFVIVPIASIVLIISVFRSRGHRRLSVLSMLIIFWVISWGMIRHTYDLRTMGRWVLWSSEYKAQVLAQPVNDGLRHAEWMAGGLLDRTPLCTWCLIRLTRWRGRRKAVRLASSKEYPAKFRGFADWRASGTPWCFIRIPTGKDCD